MPFPPRAAFHKVCFLAEGSPIAKASSGRPKPFVQARRFGKRDEFKVDVGEESPFAWFNCPVADHIANNERPCKQPFNTVADQSILRREHHLIGIRHPKDTDLLRFAGYNPRPYLNRVSVSCDKIQQSLCAVLFDCLTYLSGSTPTHAPRVLGNLLTPDISHTHPLALRVTMIDLLEDRAPHQPSGRVSRGRGFSTDTHHRAHHGARRGAITPQQDRGGGAVSGDIGARGVDDMGQVDGREKAFHELFTELPLHEGVGHDQANEAGALGLVLGLGERPEAFAEGRNQGVLATATGEALAIEGGNGAVLDRDIGWVSHHRRVLAGQDGVGRLQVLGGKGVTVKLIPAQAEVFLRVLQPQGSLGTPVITLIETVQQAVAGGDPQMKIRRQAKFAHLGQFQGGNQQAEAGDGHCEGVEVDAGDAVQGLLHGDVEVFRALAQPARGQAVEGAEQEVAGPTGRVEQIDFFQRIAVQGRGEGAIQDEGLDELRRLQQGIALPGRFGEVLVEIAEKTRVPVGVAKIMHQGAAVGVGGAEKAHQLPGHVGGDRGGQQALLHLEYIGQTGEPTGQGEDLPQVVVVGREGLLAVKPFLAGDGGAALVVGAGDQGGIEQAIVLAKTNEDAGQHPGHGGLGELGLRPGGQGLGGAPSVAGRLPVGAETRLIAGVTGEPPAQVLFQVAYLGFEIGE